MRTARHTLLVILGPVLVVGVLSVPEADAGGPFWRKRTVSRPAPSPSPRAYVVTENPANANAPSPMLGTFYSTPYANVRGNGTTGGGYSPLGQYGISNLSIYGPLSIYRSTSVPVPVYSRGYDGAVVQTEGTSFSTPNLPNATPVVNPTPAAVYGRPLPYHTRTGWPSAINWIDQN